MLMPPQLMPKDPAPADRTPHKVMLHAALGLELCCASQSVANAAESSDLKMQSWKNQPDQICVEQHTQRGSSHTFLSGLVVQRSRRAAAAAPAA